MPNNDSPTANPAWMAPIQGNKRDHHGDATRALAARISTVYESKESASGIINTTNITTVAGFTTLFSTVKIAYRVIIRTDKDITVAFNSVSNDYFTIAANTSYDCDFVEVTSIFVTAAASAALKIILA